jgi:hypothetical protein
VDEPDTTTENYVESTENNTNAVDEPDTTHQVQVETTTENYVEPTENDTNAVDEPDEPMTSDRDTVETTTANDMNVKKMWSWKTTPPIRAVAVGVAWMPLRAPNIVATQTDKSLQAATPSSNTWKEAFPEAVAYAMGATQKWRKVIAAVGANTSLQAVRIPVYIRARRCYRTASPTT